MKKIYYISPFVIIPIIFLIVTLLESAEILEPVVPYFMLGTLFLFAVVIGFLSPTKLKFDYVMPVLVPCSVLLSLFVALFFDKGCDGKPQLSLHHALNMEYYNTLLPLLLIMMVCTFVFSFKSIRNFIKDKFF